MEEQQRIKEIAGRDVYVREFEEIKTSEWMIDDRDYNIFY